MLDAVIDISHHNSVTSFSKARDVGVRALFHKATQGLHYVDPRFKNQRSAASAAGLLVGAYHFGVAGDPVGQAEQFIGVVGHDAVLVLDFEGNPNGESMSLGQAEQFVHHVHALTGRYPGLYSGNTIKEALAKHHINKAQDTELSQCWLWIAQYGQAPVLPSVWPQWKFWQYTDGGMVDGIGRCDRDYFNGSSEELQAFWNENGTWSRGPGLAQ